jgi:transcriptional regulator with XRE-family HTH domain
LERLQVDFQLLQIRLIAHIKARVRNGDGTERSLARLSGISQPHMHNVLKGVRVFSPELADQILRRLRIDLLDLLEGNEAGNIPRRASREEPLYRTVALLDGFIGPEYPYPAASGHGGYPFLEDDLKGLESPVAARLAPDPRMAEPFGGDAVVLLDRSEARRGSPDEGYYALDLGGQSGIRRVRPGTRSLYLLGRDAGEDSQKWPSVALPHRSLLQLIKGRVCLVVRRL